MATSKNFYNHPILTSLWAIFFGLFILLISGFAQGQKNLFQDSSPSWAELLDEGKKTKRILEAALEKLNENYDDDTLVRLVRIAWFGSRVQSARTLLMRYRHQYKEINELLAGSDWDLTFDEDEEVWVTLTERIESHVQATDSRALGVETNRLFNLIYGAREFRTGPGYIDEGGNWPESDLDAAFEHVAALSEYLLWERLGSAVGVLDFSYDYLAKAVKSLLKRVNLIVEDAASKPKRVSSLVLNALVHSQTKSGLTAVLSVADREVGNKDPALQALVFSQSVAAGLRLWIETFDATTLSERKAAEKTFLAWARVVPDHVIRDFVNTYSQLAKK